MKLPPYSRVGTVIKLAKALANKQANAVPRWFLTIGKVFYDRFECSWCSKRRFGVENLTKSIKMNQNSLIRPVGRVAPKSEKSQKLQPWWIEVDLLGAPRPLFCWWIASMDMFLVCFQTKFHGITSNPLKFHQFGGKNRENPRLLDFTIGFPYKTDQKSRLFSQPWWIEGDLSGGSRVVLSGSRASLDTYLVYFQTNLDGVDSNPLYATYFGCRKSRLFGDSGDGWLAERKMSGFEGSR